MRLGGIRLATIGGWRHLASKNMLQTKIAFTQSKKTGVY